MLIQLNKMLIHYPLDYFYSAMFLFRLPSEDVLSFRVGKLYKFYYVDGLESEYKATLPELFVYSFKFS